MPILRKTEIFEEFVMEKKIIYLKAEQSSYVNHGKIHIGDIASVFCEDKEIEKKIKNIVLYEFDEKNEKEGRVFLSILLLIEKISGTGDKDFIYLCDLFFWSRHYSYGIQ